MLGPSVNAYAVVTCGRSAPWRSAVHASSTCPVFNAKANFKDVDGGRPACVEVKLYSKNAYVSDDFLGEVSVPLIGDDEVFDGTVREYQLWGRGEVAGSITLGLSKSFWASAGDSGDGDDSLLKS